MTEKVPEDRVDRYAALCALLKIPHHQIPPENDTAYVKTLLEVIVQDLELLQTSTTDPFWKAKHMAWIRRMNANSHALTQQSWCTPDVAAALDKVIEKENASLPASHQDAVRSSLLLYLESSAWERT